ncbi:MAG: hypothetical protein NC205_05495 [Prevotella sp.]|nr:hypothetical protein [Alistipes senegalensis]MCM1358029.1 hypothetical protein [Prevotella sp.]MCM1472999.1 hypothetical protein [Muribaculaceae bacterium]
MTENYNIPLKYKEGTYKPEEITDFSGETINIEYIGCEIFRYIVPEHDEEVRIYGVSENPVFMATYDSDGVIKHIELHRENRIELVYINFRDNEHAKENIWQYSCFWGDWISEKILERKEKISRLFIDYFYDGQSVNFLVNTYTPEDVRKVIDDYNKYIESKGEKYKKCPDCHVEDSSGNYYRDRDIVPDIETLRIMLLCTSPDFAGELYGFAVYVMTNRIKSNVLDKIDKTEDFKFIAQEYD